MGYQIRQVSQLLGVPKNTLIAWERRYNIVAPGRTEGGYRMYSEQDLATLRRVKLLIDQGYRIGEACRQVLDGGPVDPLALPAPEGLPAPGQAALAPMREALLGHLLAFDRDSADRIAQRLVLLPFEGTLDEILLPILREVGDRWKAGEVSISQEHHVTAWVRERLAIMRSSVAGSTGPGAARRPAAVCLSTVCGADTDIVGVARDLRARLPADVRLAIGGSAVHGLTPPVPGVEFSQDVVPAFLSRLRRH
jgi:DNA-binding transcriptional MerR regulator